MREITSSAAARRRRGRVLRLTLLAPDRRGNPEWEAASCSHVERAYAAVPDTMGGSNQFQTAAELRNIGWMRFPSCIRGFASLRLL